MSGPGVRQAVGRGGFETFFLSDGIAEAELVPARGAIVSRLAVGDDEVLFLDEATLGDPKQNVRGGIPLLFPIAGKLPDDAWSWEHQRLPMAQHGFARKLAWEPVASFADDSTARVECRLRSSPETRLGYPFDFDARFTVSLFDGRLLLDFALTNTGQCAMPWQFGLHPYFRIPKAAKARARVETHASRVFDNRAGAESALPAIDFSQGELDLQLLDHETNGTALHRGDGSRLRLSWTAQFNTLVLWTLPGRDFVCVEPWTAAGGALATGRGLLLLSPGSTERLTVEISLES